MELCVNKFFHKIPDKRFRSGLTQKEHFSLHDLFAYLLITTSTNWIGIRLGTDSYGSQIIHPNNINGVCDQHLTWFVQTEIARQLYKYSYSSCDE